MPRSNNRGRPQQQPEGRNQYSDWGVMEMARERPFAAAAAAAGAAAAGPVPVVEARADHRSAIEILATRLVNGAKDRPARQASSPAVMTQRA